MLGHDITGTLGAPWLLLSGSLGTTYGLWDELMPAFGASFRVLRHDHPGHGSSPLPSSTVTVDDIGRSVIDLLDSIGIERISVCGLSLGGMVALWLGANAPSRVERLVVACSGAKLGTREAYSDRAALVRREGMSAVVEGSRQRWFTPEFAATPAAGRLLDELRALEPEGYASCCEAVGAFDFRNDLGRISASTLVLVGSDDPLTTPEVVTTLTSSLPAVTLETIPHAAHLAAAEQPKAFGNAALAHLTGAPDRRPV